jgi:hypothetical protein
LSGEGLADHLLLVGAGAGQGLTLDPGQEGQRRVVEVDHGPPSGVGTGAPAGMPDSSSSVETDRPLLARQARRRDSSITAADG